MHLFRRTFTVQHKCQRNLTLGRVNKGLIITRVRINKGTLFARVHADDETFITRVKVNM